MKVHIIEQGTPEWDALRLGRFTASSAQAIASDGKGLETLIYQKAAEILTGKPAKEAFTNEDIERGKQLEHLARNAYEIQTGFSVMQIGFVEESEFIGASPDGKVDPDGLVEIKCKNDVNFLRFMIDRKIDPAHMWQMQMQMSVCDREWVDYLVYNENFPEPLIITRVQRNEVQIAKLRTGLQSAVGQLTSILEKVNEKKGILEN